MRTHGEVVQFVKQCVKIEQKGGDVLGYIAKNWPSYTPRATWYNLQRGYLNRKTHQLTEGRPKVKIERKEEEPMKKREDTELLAKAVIQCHQTGGDVRQLLLDRGYKDASAELSNLKCQFKRKDPELYLELKEIRLQRVSTRKAKKPVPEPAKAEVGGTLGEPDEDVEVVKHGGKEYVKMECIKKYPPFPNAIDKDIHGNHPVTVYIEKKPSPTCCQPARPSGVTVPDEIPEEKPVAELKVCAVLSNVVKTSRYENSTLHAGSIQYMTYIWRDEITKEERHLSLPASTWARLIAEIPQALRQLGLIT